MEEGSVFRSLLAILQWWGFNVTVIIMNKWIFQETEAMRKRLQTTRERKAKLIAEVRHMKEDQPQDVTKVRVISNGGNKIRVQVSPNKKTKHVSLPDLNQSGKVHDETKTSLTRKVPSFDLNQISANLEVIDVETYDSAVVLCMVMFRLKKCMVMMLLE